MLNKEDNPPLLVPFAIPPMLARWDRALSELRETWDVDSMGDFPVPVAAPRPQTEPANTSGPLDDVVNSEEVPQAQAVQEVDEIAAEEEAVQEVDAVVPAGEE